jgi:hypothetical protein
MSFGFCLQDDTYIGLRFSRNFAAGEGLVFNPGDKVEGYTNFLWILLGSVPYICGIDPIFFIRFVGVISAILAAIASGKFAYAISGKSRLSFAVAAFLFASLPFAMGEAAMGLETLLFSFLVISGFAEWLLEENGTKRNGFSSGIYIALSALTRPEGLAIGLFLFGVDGFRRIRNTDRVVVSRRFFQRWMIFAFVAVSHIVFRFLYYADFVPNTFHAKVGLCPYFSVKS